MRKSLATISILTLSITLLSYLLGSCRKDLKTAQTHSIQFTVPEGFPQPLYRFQDNPLTEEGFQLGRKLFYEGLLSIDTVHPCSGCHQEIAGFGTYEHDRSHGVYNSHTLRNAPVLFNLAWSKSFHWDGEFNSLIEEATHPITGHVEMGENFQDVIDRLNKDPEYRREFKNVFGYSFIRPEDILKALSQFTGTLVSSDSKYDRVKKGMATFSASEANGYLIFKSVCATCHTEPLFTDHELHNIGLPLDPLLNDLGRMRVTGKPEDSLKFKTPSLRSVYISSNYMHDGRFNTLQQVINFYRTGIQQSSTLDAKLKNGITMSDADAVNLFNFLRTLTDSSFITNPRYDKP